MEIIGRRQFLGTVAASSLAVGCAKDREKSAGKDGKPGKTMDDTFFFYDDEKTGARVYNLTAVRDHDRMVPQHLLDSLAVAPHLTGETLLDVGDLWPVREHRLA